MKNIKTQQAETYSPAYPQTRMRRMRHEPWMRELVAEHRLCAADLIWPLFIQEGEGLETPIAAMPGVSRYSIDLLVEQVAEAKKLRIPAVALFPSTPARLKDEDGTEALNPENLVCRAIQAVKREVPGIGVIADVALDPYTAHGHDGVMRKGRIANDETLEILAKQAVVQAQAGCDIVAPSDMMDGRVGIIRASLDAAGFHDCCIMAYAAKYASAFYGPFREAVGSAGKLGKSGGVTDKKTYQMDPRNGAEALREVALDVLEGADMLMIKPGMPYLDIVARVKSEFALPLFVYQVSGEYSMLKCAESQGLFNGQQAMLEALTAFKRAGADGIFTYAAKEIASILQSEIRSQKPEIRK